MAGEKNITKYEQTVPGDLPDSSINVPEKDERTLDSDSESSGVKVVNEQPSPTEQDVNCPSASCYDYYYPNYNGAYAQLDDEHYLNPSGGPDEGIQSVNASLLYYVPGYGPYPTGFVDVNGKQTFTASEYLQQPSPYGSEAFSSYTYDSTYVGTGSSGSNVRSHSFKSSTSSSVSGKSDGFNHARTNNSFSNDSLTLYSNPRYQKSNFSRPTYQYSSVKPLNEPGSGYQSSSSRTGFRPNENLSSFTGRTSGVYMQQDAANYHSNARLWNNTYRPNSRETFVRNREMDYSIELPRGPRGDNSNHSSEIDPTSFIGKKQYNFKEFQTEYNDAKFFVIKSYSEDDVHKSIKYGVWSSTPNGNKKLDAAFREADAKTNEQGVKCPMFLFFSVNRSGQFVGVAEMMGQVDFSKNMDFWQLDKWNGFFPLKWHIIKDVPNTQLRHIILQTNENKPVTFSRDIQEVGLKQGIEILGIFKNYPEKKSVLDDFNFYETREMSLKAKRAAKQTSQTTNDSERQLDSGEPSDPSSIIGSIKKLTIKEQ